MGLPLERAARVSIRDVGYDETWLQDSISQYPSILGLGPLETLDRERIQSSGGRVDILLADRDSQMMYEVEAMLGTLDESHLVRAIEYWDIETRRYREWDHRPVVIAEEITHRYFNVLTLLSRHIPFLAIQVNANRTPDGRVFLTAIKVIDAYERPQEEETAALTSEERAFVAFWKELIARAKSKTRLHAACVPTKNFWLRQRTGFTGMFFDYSIEEGELWVGLSIEAYGSSEKCKMVVDQLRSREKEIETSFGGPLTWSLGKAWAWVGVRVSPSLDLDKPNTWPTVQSAAIDSMVRLESAMRAPLQSVSKPG